MQHTNTSSTSGGSTTGLFYQKICRDDLGARWLRAHDEEQVQGQFGGQTKPGRLSQKHPFMGGGAPPGICRLRDGWECSGLYTVCLDMASFARVMRAQCERHPRGFPHAPRPATVRCASRFDASIVRRLDTTRAPRLRTPYQNSVSELRLRTSTQNSHEPGKRGKAIASRMLVTPVT